MVGYLLERVGSAQLLLATSLSDLLFPGFLCFPFPSSSKLRTSRKYKRGGWEVRKEKGKAIKVTKTL